MEDIAIKSNGRMTGAGIWLSHLFDNLGLDRTIASCGSFCESWIQPLKDKLNKIRKKKMNETNVRSPVRYDKRR